MIYKTKYCPNCKHAVQVRKPDRGPIYDSPLRQCPLCKKYYIDTDYQEFAVSCEGPSAFRRRSIISRLLRIPLEGILFAAGLLLLAGVLSVLKVPINYEVTRSRILLFYLVGCFITLIRVFPTKGRIDQDTSNMLDAWTASDSRLRNNEYAVLLKKAHIPVPARYLPSNIDDLLPKEQKTSISESINAYADYFVNTPMNHND